MIKVEKDSILVFKKTIREIKNNKELGLYCYLLARQQEGIFYQSIKEIVKDYKKMSYKTGQKYLKMLIKHKLVVKYQGIYFINYFKQESAE